MRIRKTFPQASSVNVDPLLDHGTMIPLYFLHRQWSSGEQPPFRIIRIGLSGLSLEDHYRFGMLIRKAVES